MSNVLRVAGPVGWRPDSRGEVAAGLGGTGRIADDLYLISHHELTGKQLLQPRVLGFALAGGLLAELIGPGVVGIGPQGVMLLGRAASAEAVQMQVLQVIAGEGERHPVREWLQFLARTIASDVAIRLEGAGYLTRVKGKGLWKSVRWVPVDQNAAFAPLLRIRAALNPMQLPSEYGATLTGLAAASGLGYRITEYTTPGTVRSVAELSSYVKPALRELIAETQAAVDSALLSHRA